MQNKTVSHPSYMVAKSEGEKSTMVNIGYNLNPLLKAKDLDTVQDRPPILATLYLKGFTISLNSTALYYLQNNLLEAAVKLKGLGRGQTKEFKKTVTVPVEIGRRDYDLTHAEVVEVYEQVSGITDIYRKKYQFGLL
jgi:uncharacterized membrane protein YciS (DUF1049 family)